MDGWNRQAEGRRNVRDGRVPPDLYALLREADGSFTPTISIIPERLRRVGKELLKNYRAGIQRFNKMGKPLPNDPTEMGDEVTPPRILAGNAEIADHARSRGDARRHTEICVAASPLGAPRILSQKSSSIPALDRLARRSLQQAFPSTTFPADFPRCTACFRFSVSYGRI